MILKCIPSFPPQSIYSIAGTCTHAALRAIEVREEGRLFDDPLAAALAGPDALREADVYAKVQYSASYFAIILTGELNSLNSNDRLSAQLTAPDKLREANVSATVCSHQVPLIPGKKLHVQEI